MKKRYVLAFFVAALVGTGLHFLYPLLPVPVVGLFAPVSESVWEHLKLLYWPFLAVSFFLCRRADDAPAAWSGPLLALLVMPVFLLGVYYTLLDGFDVQSLWVDISLYYLTLALGTIVSYRVTKSGKLGYLAGVLVIGVGLYGACLVLFTMAPPELSIFVP